MARKQLITGILIMMMAFVAVWAEDLPIPPSATGTEFLNEQILADQAAVGDPDRVYVLERDGIYLWNALLTNTGWVLRIKAADGAGAKPLLYLVSNEATGTFPSHFIEMGEDLILQNIGLVGFVEEMPDQIANDPPRLIRSRAAGFDLILDGCIITSSRGEHIRLEQATRVVKITNCLFGNMGDLGISNLGAGKPIDFRDASCDSAIFINNTFVNFQDRIVRHRASVAPIKYFEFDHNTAVNSLGYHGTLALGWVGKQVKITNNLFIDTFIAGADTDKARQSEFNESGEIDPRNGLGRMTWVISVPNDTTEWKVSGNFYSVSKTVSDFYKAHKAEGVLGEGPALTYHINSRLGADSTKAFKKASIKLTESPLAMVNMAEWYRLPEGGKKTKNTPCACWNRETDDYDRRFVSYYTDTLDCTYPRTSTAYVGAEMSYPAGDLNWWPELKEIWEGPTTPTLTMEIDGQKDAFYDGLTGPDDGYLQLRSYAWNNNGQPDNDTDLSAKIWCAWDEDWLYSYVEVKDDTISASQTANAYSNDGFELKVDPQATDSTQTVVNGYVNLTALYEAGSEPGQENMTNIPVFAKKSARRITDDGYVIEYAVRWVALYSGTETVSVVVDNVFGAALNVHDNDNTTGMRDASICWAAVMLDQTWNTPEYHGTVKFLAGNKLQFIPSNNMTPRTNIIPYDGSEFDRTGVAGRAAPQTYALEQNYPNPFNPSTTITFVLEKPGFTTLKVYNTLGQEVATLLSEKLPQGYNEVNFDASVLSNGVYFYKLKSGEFTSIKKMLLIK